MKPAVFSYKIKRVYICGEEYHNVKHYSLLQQQGMMLKRRNDIQLHEFFLC